MIFVTVGAQMPFDRLVAEVDQWAGHRDRTDVFAQIGPTEYQPKHMAWERFLTPSAYRARFDESHAVISHAGMGTLITALQMGKPVIVMPRRADLNETRNDHQVATAQRFASKQGVYAVFDQAHLGDQLDRVDTLAAERSVEPFASEELITAISKFIRQGS